MNLNFAQICQLLEASDLCWGAELVACADKDEDGRYWTFRCWRHDPGRFYADARSDVSAQDAARQVYEKVEAVLNEEARGE